MYSLTKATTVITSSRPSGGRMPNRQRCSAPTY